MQVYCRFLGRRGHTHPKRCANENAHVCGSPIRERPEMKLPAVGIGPHRPIAHPAAGRFTFYDTPSTHELSTGLPGRRPTRKGGRLNRGAPRAAGGARVDGKPFRYVDQKGERIDEDDECLQRIDALVQGRLRAHARTGRTYGITTLTKTPRERRPRRNPDEPDGAAPEGLHRRPPRPGVHRQGLSYVERHPHRGRDARGARPSARSRSCGTSTPTGSCQRWPALPDPPVPTVGARETMRRRPVTAAQRFALSARRVAVNHGNGVEGRGAR